MKLPDQFPQQTNLMFKNSTRPDNELTLLNGEHVTRVQFNVVLNRIQELAQELYQRTGELPLQFKDITNQVILESKENHPVQVSSQPHADLYLGYWQKDKRVCIV